MKVAAAVLGASLLFFLGVLTGAGRREALPPPAAIRLGVGAPASPSDPSSSPQTPASTPGATTPNPPAAGSDTSKVTATTTRTDVTVRPAPGGVTTTTPGSGGEGTSTSTTDPGQVEQVGNQVDCRPAGKPGKGKKEPCPSTTTSPVDAPGGVGNR